MRSRLNPPGRPPRQVATLAGTFVLAALVGCNGAPPPVAAPAASAAPAPIVAAQVTPAPATPAPTPSAKPQYETGVVGVATLGGLAFAGATAQAFLMNGKDSKPLASGTIDATGKYLMTFGADVKPGAPIKVIATRDGKQLIGCTSAMVAAGGGNMVAAGAGNMVAAGGGNLVAAGGGNMVAAGGGNLVAAGGGNLVAAGGGNLVAAGGGNVVAAGGGNVVGQNGQGYVVKQAASRQTGLRLDEARTLATVALLSRIESAADVTLHDDGTVDFTNLEAALTAIDNLVEQTQALLDTLPEGFLDTILAANPANESGERVLDASSLDVLRSQAPELFQAIDEAASDVQTALDEALRDEDVVPAEVPIVLPVEEVIDPITDPEEEVDPTPTPTPTPSHAITGTLDVPHPPAKPVTIAGRLGVPTYPSVTATIAGSLVLPAGPTRHVTTSGQLATPGKLDDAPALLTVRGWQFLDSLAPGEVGWTRVSLVFSEPVRGFQDASAFSFALANAAGSLPGLTGSPLEADMGRSVVGVLDFEREFTIDPAIAVVHVDAGAPNTVHIDMMPLTPWTFIFDRAATQLRVRVNPSLIKDYEGNSLVGNETDGPLLSDVSDTVESPGPQL